jgi:hypothetical protein
MEEKKFRRLRREELEEIRPQFVKYLAVNGIDGSTWESIKINDPKRTDELLFQFSQIVFKGVIEKVSYLLERNARDLKAYHCLPDKVVMNGLLVKGTTDLKLNDTTVAPEEMMRKLLASGAEVQLFSGERAYRAGDREQDVFLLMEQGALISDDHLFNTLEGLKGV